MSASAASINAFISDAPSFANQTYNDVYHLTAEQGILGVICMVVGAFLLIFGHKLWRPTLFLAGFVAGSVIGYSILANVEPSGGYPRREDVLLFGAIAFGIIGGMLTLCVRTLGLAIIGGLGGYFLAIFILGLHDDGIIESGWGRAIFLAAMVIAGIVFVFYFEKHAIIIATAAAGAYLIVFGIDCFAHVGFVQATQEFLSAGSNHSITGFEVNWKVIALDVTVVVLFVMGLIIQYRINMGRTFFDDRK
ncbi:hypothetical protein HK101_005234 [Irineochytrium annulatum]|nr:hypothetical protein HK101_005234 [Irineochytrium annulatum]